MSTAAVSSSSVSQQYFQTRQADLQQLGKALSNGDLAGAQSAFQAITKLGQNGPFTNGDPFAGSKREQDFTAIGKALQSGDLAGAQAAFTNLKSTFGNKVNTASTSTTGPEIILNIGQGASNSQGAGSASPSIEQITINLNPSSGGGEQLSISAGQQGSNPQQVTLNLAPNSNEQIVLNLLGASSATSGSSSNSSAGATPATALNVSA